VDGIRAWLETEPGEIVRDELQTLRAEVARLTDALAAVREAAETNAGKWCAAHEENGRLTAENERLKGELNQAQTTIGFLTDGAAKLQAQTDKANDELDQAREASRWIPVSERLPEPDPNFVGYSE
jgi:predicted nuclease with TOPRIM domain